MPGMQRMMLPQGIMIGGQGQQLGLLGNNQGNGNNAGGNQMQGLNIGQLSGIGVNGLPMGFVMQDQQNAQQGVADKKGTPDKIATNLTNPKIP